MERGKHLLIDCRNVPRDVCLNDGLVLDAMSRAARRAGATVISQVRYQFGHESPPGFTAVVLLDESHCSAHTYADLGLIALDIFTCGDTDPRDVLDLLREEVELGEVTVRELPRFPQDEEGNAVPRAAAVKGSGRPKGFRAREALSAARPFRPVRLRRKPPP